MRLDESGQELRERRLAALDRLDEFRDRFARLHPPRDGAPLLAADLIRQERSRDDLDGVAEYADRGHG